MLKYFFLFVFLFSPVLKADIYVTPFSINFGNQIVNSSSFYRDATVYNRSPNMTRIDVRSTCGADFYINHTCYGYVYGGSSCRITASFRPSRIGWQSCTINIYDDSAFWETLDLAGYGVEQ